MLPCRHSPISLQRHHPVRMIAQNEYPDTVPRIILVVLKTNILTVPRIILVVLKPNALTPCHASS
jgi:hypothetical protein